MSSNPALETAKQQEQQTSKPMEKVQQQVVGAPQPQHNCKVILAGTVANKLMEEVRRDVEKLGKKPLLVGFLANTDPAAKMYADWTAKTCRDK